MVEGDGKVKEESDGGKRREGDVVAREGIGGEGGMVERDLMMV